MITLNLIPHEQKSLHLKMHVQQIIRNNLFLIFITASVISAALLVGRLYLENRFTETVIDTTRINTDLYSPVSENVKASNDILKIAKTIQDEFTPWHTLLIRLGEITPKNVTLRQIVISHDTSSLSLLGYATDRSSFLQFSEALEADELFVTVESPISNILNKVDINFSLNIILNTELIK